MAAITLKKKRKKASDRHIYTLTFILGTRSSTSQHPLIISAFRTMNIVSVAMSVRDPAVCVGGGKDGQPHNFGKSRKV